MAPPPPQVPFPTWAPVTAAGRGRGRGHTMPAWMAPSVQTAQRRATAAEVDALLESFAPLAHPPAPAPAAPLPLDVEAATTQAREAAAAIRARLQALK